MAWWNDVAARARAGVGGVTERAAAGTRGLREASAVVADQAAGRTPSGAGATADAGADVDAGAGAAAGVLAGGTVAHSELHLSVAEALLLVRYLGGRAALGRVEPFGLGKYAFLAIAVGLLALTDASPAFVALFVAVFVVAALAQWLLTRAIRRFGMLEELSGLESAAGQARTVWWPNLQAELRRVGLPATPLALVRLGGAHVSRRAGADQRAALAEVDWLAVLPYAQWREARALLADTARR